MKPELNHLSNPSTGFKPSSSQVVDPKGKGIKCFKCQRQGHMAYNYPMKNLHIGLEYEDEPEPAKQDNGNSFDYGVYDLVDLDDEELDGQLVSMGRRILAVSKVEEEDWCRNPIFQMLVRCRNQAQKLIIDSGSCMNVVSSSTTKRLKLPVEPHPQPYKVA